jgi:hypothetical protein
MSVNAGLGRPASNPVSILIIGNKALEACQLTEFLIRFADLSLLRI